MAEHVGVGHVEHHFAVSDREKFVLDFDADRKLLVTLVFEKIRKTVVKGFSQQEVQVFQRDPDQVHVVIRDS